jgi:hypothetical protein
MADSDDKNLVDEAWLLLEKARSLPSRQDRIRLREEAAERLRRTDNQSAE